MIFLNKATSTSFLSTSFLSTSSFKPIIHGHNMFRVVKKLKYLKKPLRSLFIKQGNLHEKVTKLRHELDVVQKALDSNPSSTVLREEEACYLTAFNQAVIDEERF